MALGRSHFFIFVVLWDIGLGGVGVWSRTMPSGVVSFWSYRFSTERQRNRRDNKKKQEMLQYVTDAPGGPLCATHLLIMLYLSVMFR